jgi:hypothetical protein
MRRKSSTHSKYAPQPDDGRGQAIRAAIGRMLQAQYGLAAPLPARLENLVNRLADADQSAAVMARRTPPGQEPASR